MDHRLSRLAVKLRRVIVCDRCICNVSPYRSYSCPPEHSDNSGDCYSSGDACCSTKLDVAFGIGVWYNWRVYLDSSWQDEIDCEQNHIVQSGAQQIFLKIRRPRSP